MMNMYDQSLERSHPDVFAKRMHLQPSPVVPGWYEPQVDATRDGDRYLLGMAEGEPLGDSQVSALARRVRALAVGAPLYQPGVLAESAWVQPVDTAYVLPDGTRCVASVSPTFVSGAPNRRIAALTLGAGNGGPIDPDWRYAVRMFPQPGERGVRGFSHLTLVADLNTKSVRLFGLGAGPTRHIRLGRAGFAEITGQLNDHETRPLGWLGQGLLKGRARKAQRQESNTIWLPMSRLAPASRVVGAVAARHAQ